MEADERDRQERLTSARKKEASMKKMLQGRVVKRQVGDQVASQWSLLTVDRKHLI